MWHIADQDLPSRLILGTAGYSSPVVMREAIIASECSVVTVSLRREQGGSGAAPSHKFWDYIKDLGVRVLPNTAGCSSVSEAVTTAQMSRDLFDTNWVKLEVIGDEWTLQPDPWRLVEAAERLLAMGFVVFPYITDDLVVAAKLVDLGCKILMPWASPIGSGLGLANPMALTRMRARFPGVQMIVDAGIGRPSDAVKAMEMGMDGIILNTAVAKAGDPVGMAKAFSLAVASGHLAHASRVIDAVDFARPSTPILGLPFSES